MKIEMKMDVDCCGFVEFWRFADLVDRGNVSNNEREREMLSFLFCSELIYSVPSVCRSDSY